LGAVPAPGEFMQDFIHQAEWGNQNYFYKALDFRAQLLTARTYHFEIYSNNNNKFSPQTGNLIIKSDM
jgi:hypothetical protein